MPVLDSTALGSVSYDETRRTLRATFRDNRRTYIYEGIPPKAYADLMAAESRGAWFNAHIRDQYRFREVA